MTRFPKEPIGPLKRCTFCESIKIRDDFAIDRHQTSGLRPRCRACMQATRNAANAEKRTTSRTSQCVVCETPFTFDVVKGRPPTHCDGCVAAGRKRCTTCLVVKHHEEFYNYCQGKSRRQPTCKLCHKANRMSRAGISSMASYWEIVHVQGNQCGLCRSSDPGGHAVWVVDHDHQCCPVGGSCGKCVRTLLCILCNTGGGWFGESPERLRSAARYIEWWDARLPLEAGSPDHLRAIREWIAGLTVADAGSLSADPRTP